MPRTSCALAALSLAVAAGSVNAATIEHAVVSAFADLYQSAFSTGKPNQPQAIDVAGKVSVSFRVTGTVSFNQGSGDNVNDADGIGSASDIIATPAHLISGISAPHAGFLAGVYLGESALPPTPHSLNFQVRGTEFTRLKPKLQQAFFIGDGLTGDATGTRQKFLVPPGATTLYLGVIDACNYRGNPDQAICYADNAGEFHATVTVNGPAQDTDATPQGR